MAVLPVLFDVPQWVADGVKMGDLRVFGGVVRDGGGQIVLHLKEAIPKKPQGDAGKYVVVGAAVVGVAAVVAGGVYIARRYTRKGRALAALNDIDKTMAGYLMHAKQRELGAGDAGALAGAIERYLDTVRKPELREVRIEAPGEVTQRLRDLVGAIRAFNTSASEQVDELLPPPVSQSEDDSLEPLLDDLLTQLRYQKTALCLVRAA